MSSHRIWHYGDHINTDLIFAGKYTYTLKTEAEIASKALEDLDPDFVKQVQVGDIIVAGHNWGCGSSREQAVTTLKYNGIRMIIAASFNGLYFRNCINQGIQPMICPELRDLVQTGDRLEIIDNTIIVADRQFSIPTLSPVVQAILDAGGLVPMLQQSFKEIAI